MTEKPAMRAPVAADAAFSPTGDPRPHPAHPDAPRGRTEPPILGSRLWLLPAGGAMAKLEENVIAGRWWYCLGNLAFIALWLWLAKPRKPKEKSHA